MSNARVSPISRSLEPPPNKRARFAPSAKHHKDSIAPAPSRVIDPTYGQSCAFPGLDDDGAKNPEQLFYGPAEDGLEYLQMVRSEARSVPKLLVAPSKSVAILQTGGANGSGGSVSRDRESSFYSDGTYASICAEKIPPDPSSFVANSRREDGAMPQKLFALSLLRRFDGLRRDLKQGLSFTADSNSVPGSLRSWRGHIISTPPSPNFVGRLEQPQILLALRALEDLFSLQCLSSLSFDTHRHIGSWAISLLAVCRDVGDMDSEDVGVVRGLGKSATTELRRLVAFGVHIVGPPPAADKNMNGNKDEFQRRSLARDRNTSSPSSTGSPNDSPLNSPSQHLDGTEQLQDEMDGVEGDDLVQARQRLLATFAGNDLGTSNDASDLAEIETPSKKAKAKAPPCSAESRVEDFEQGAKNTDEQPADRLAIEGSNIVRTASELRAEGQQQQQQERDEAEEEEEEEGQVDEEDEEEGGEEENKTKEDDDEWVNGGAAVAIRALYECVILLVGRRYGQRDLLEMIARW